MVYVTTGSMTRF